MPTPISMTPASDVTPQSSAIFGQTDGSVMKFCPNDFEKVKPCRDKTRLTVLMSVKSIFIS